MAVGGFEPRWLRSLLAEEKAASSAFQTSQDTVEKEIIHFPSMSIRTKMVLYVPKNKEAEARPKAQAALRTGNGCYSNATGAYTR
jgi:hypothetical protein